MIRKRLTKIVATLGPATDEDCVLRQMLEAGVDVVRLNFSHGTHEEHRSRLNKVRQLSTELGREVGVIADLQGPKIRIGGFTQHRVELQTGASFTLDADLATNAGTESHVGIDYKELVNDVENGDVLLLDDGHIELLVKEVIASKIICEVLEGGILTDNKGINKQGGGLSAKALTHKDQDDLRAAVAMDVDFIAVSFPKDAQDILEARELIKAAGGSCDIIAKIERSEAVLAIDDIINVSDAVMLARGDLAVEIGDAAVPGVQKEVISRARSLNKAVITATQMMESMITSSVPTRAEVSDVANAILDGTDAVMLSAETAIGEHPARVISTVNRICEGAEKHPATQISSHRIECRFERIDEAIAMATMYVANHLNIKAIIALTESGSTPLWMSRIRSGIPIYGLSRHVATLRKTTLFRGVFPIQFDRTSYSYEAINRQCVKILEDLGLVHSGDLIAIAKGDFVDAMRGTNTMKIVEVGAVH